jgi:hypothetical protein
MNQTILFLSLLALGSRRFMRFATLTQFGPCGKRDFDCRQLERLELLLLFASHYVVFYVVQNPLTTAVQVRQE